MCVLTRWCNRFQIHVTGGLHVHKHLPASKRGPQSLMVKTPLERELQMFLQLTSMSLSLPVFFMISAEAAAADPSAPVASEVSC